MIHDTGKHIVVILGMHRSGTSVITRGLIALGATVSENLVPAGFDNPTGFFEDKDIVSINDDLLQMFGYSYESLAPVSDNLDSDPRVSSLRQHATKLVKERISGRSLWSVKDPRMCKLLGFWKPIFTDVGAEVKYVIAVRHPLSVAKSLEVRNQFPLQKSLMLWLQHYVSAVTDTHGANRVIVDYDRFLDNPRRELETVADSLGLPELKVRDADVARFIDVFLSKDLRHNQYNLEDLMLASDIPVNVIKAYELLLGVSKGRVSASDDRFIYQWNQLKSDLDSIEPVLCFLSKRDHQSLIQEIQIQNLREHLAAQQREISVLKQTNATSKGRVADFNRSAAENNTNIRALIEKISNQEERIIAAKAILSERSRQITDLKEAISERNSRINNLTQAVSARDDQIESLNQAATRCSEQIVAARESLSAHDSRITDLTEAISERDNRINKLAEAVSARDEKIDNLNQAASRYDNQIVSLNQHIDAANDELRSVLTCRSWRVTEPLRSLRRALRTGVGRQGLES